MHRTSVDLMQSLPITGTRPRQDARQDEQMSGLENYVVFAQAASQDLYWTTSVHPTKPFVVELF